MIKTLIFDFGDVFINLDKQGAMNNALRLFRMDVFEDDMISTNMQYEIGGISTTEFIRFYKNKFSYLSEEQIIEAWNYIIKDFPVHRLEFAKTLTKNYNYKLILLSNTNEMHIDFIKKNITDNTLVINPNRFLIDEEVYRECIKEILDFTGMKCDADRINKMISYWTSWYNRQPKYILDYDFKM